MKKINIATIVIVALGFAVIGIMISYMPDIVPTHYNAMGEVDGMGSPYTYLLFPAISALSGLILLPVSKTVSNPSEKKIVLYLGVFMALLFNLMGMIFAYRAITYSPGAPAPDLNTSIFKTTFILLGILLVLLGNLMPKFRRNRITGLRTKWTLSSDEVWQKSNRFGGIAAVVCGLLMVILSALLSGAATLIIVNSSLLILWVISCCIVSYMYYKKNLH